MVDLICLFPLAVTLCSSGIQGSFGMASPSSLDPSHPLLDSMADPVRLVHSQEPYAPPGFEAASVWPLSDRLGLLPRRLHRRPMAPGKETVIAASPLPLQPPIPWGFVFGFVCTALALGSIWAGGSMWAWNGPSRVCCSFGFERGQPHLFESFWWFSNSTHTCVHSL